MKQIRINKKYLIASIITVLVLLICTLLFLKFKEVSSFYDKYSDIINLCNISQQSDQMDSECEGFLKNEYSDDNGDTCLSMLILREDYTTEQVDVCDKRTNINWINPYSDYSSYIPVIIGLDSKTLFDSEYVLSYSLNIIVMEDNRALQILDEINNNPELESISIYTEGSLEIENRGWYITNEYSSEDRENITRNLLVFDKVKINSSNINENSNLITFGISAFLGEKEINFDINSDLVYLIKSDYDTIYDSVEKLEVSNISDKNLNSIYYIQISVEGKDMLDANFIENLINNNMQVQDDEYKLKLEIIGEK